MSQNFWCHSEKMGADKVASKSVDSFFHLFDWNRKSLKKLFSTAKASSFSEEAIQGKQDEDNKPTSSNPIDEDGMLGVSSIKWSSDFSCSPSVTDEEEKGTRAPGVVARLMGLDSMPTLGISEPCSTPLHNSQSLRDDNSFVDDLPHDSMTTRRDVYSRKPVEFRFQKMPSSPIERFQIETFPLKLVKPIQSAHPKILESELQKGSTARSRLFRSSKEVIIAPRQIRRIPESFRGTAHSGVHESHRGRPFNRRCDRLEDMAVTRPLACTNDTNPSAEKGKRKSVSLAIQAGLNVQRKEGFSMNSGNTSVVKDSGGCSLNKSLKSQSSNQKYNFHKRSSTSSSCGVLRQNSQKQNYLLSKGNLASKQSVDDKHGRKNLPGVASSGKTKIVNKFSGNSKVVSVTEQLQSAYNGKMGSDPLHNNNLAQKKGSEEQSFYSERSWSIDDISLSRHGRQVRHIVVIDEHARQSTDSTKNSTDVVSFTFTSPIRKSLPGSQALYHEEETRGTKNGCSVSHSQANVAVDEDMPSHLDVVEGDSLGFLMERKLRELTYGALSPCKLVTGGSAGEAASSWNNLESSFDVSSVTPVEQESESVFSPHDDELGVSFDSSCSLTRDMESCVSHKIQEVDGVDSCTSTSCVKELDHQDKSPLSILENSFSNESYYSSESWGCDNGSKMDHSSLAMSQDIVNKNSMGKTLLIKPEKELSDKTSGSSTQNTDEPLAALICRRCHHSNPCWHELEYVQEILSNTEFVFENLAICPFKGILDPLFYDKLEENISLTTEGEEKDCRIRRKILFDSVNECLEMKSSHYFQAGYQAWAKGIAYVRKDLAEDLYEEVSGWKSIGDWLTDELVDKDMNTHLGRWINFENEAFEAGIELGRVVLNSLIDEVIACFL